MDKNLNKNNTNFRFGACNIIKKSHAIQLLRDTLTAEELKALIQPNYNHLIRMLNLYSKKDIQYLLYNTQKITMEQISNIIRKNAVEDIDEELEEIEEENENEIITAEKENSQTEKKELCDKKTIRFIEAQPILTPKRTEKLQKELKRLKTLAREQRGNPLKPPTDYKRNCGRVETPPPQAEIVLCKNNDISSEEEDEEEEDKIKISIGENVNITFDEMPNTSVADTSVADTSVADTSVADTSVANTSVADTNTELYKKLNKLRTYKSVMDYFTEHNIAKQTRECYLNLRKEALIKYFLKNELVDKHQLNEMTIKELYSVYNHSKNFVF